MSLIAQSSRTLLIIFFGPVAGVSVGLGDFIVDPLGERVRVLDFNTRDIVTVSDTLQSSAHCTVQDRIGYVLIHEWSLMDETTLANFFLLFFTDSCEQFSCQLNFNSRLAWKFIYEKCLTGGGAGPGPDYI